MLFEKGAPRVVSTYAGTPSVPSCLTPNSVSATARLTSMGHYQEAKVDVFLSKRCWEDWVSKLDPGCPMESMIYSIEFNNYFTVCSYVTSLSLGEGEL